MSVHQCLYLFQLPYWSETEQLLLTVLYVSINADVLLIPSAIISLSGPCCVVTLRHHAPASDVNMSSLEFSVQLHT